MSPEEGSWIVRSLPPSSAASTLPTTSSIVAPPSSSDNESNDATKKQQKIPTRLVLHLDINETILLGDEAGGDSLHDSLQKMLAKSAFCQIPATVATTTTPASYDDTIQIVPTHWWDGQEMGNEKHIPPLYTGWEWPPNCCPYYRTSYKKRSKQFVEQHDGRIYRPILAACEARLVHPRQRDPILPALYRTLEYVIMNSRHGRRPATIVFRTFGSDLEGIVDMVNRFVFGEQHSHEYQLYQGRWKSNGEDDDCWYELWTSDERELVARGDEEILALMDPDSSRSTGGGGGGGGGALEEEDDDDNDDTNGGLAVKILGIRDDYAFWKANGWKPTCGKPTWIPWFPTRKEDNVDDGTAPIYEHHVLFDDNIHNLKNDGIACVRQQEQEGGTFVTLDGSEMHSVSQGVHLIRVPTIEPVLDPDWFVNQIKLAEFRLQERLLQK